MYGLPTPPGCPCMVCYTPKVAHIVCYITHELWLSPVVSPSQIHDSQQPSPQLVHTVYHTTHELCPSPVISTSQSHVSKQPQESIIRSSLDLVLRNVPIIHPPPPPPDLTAQIPPTERSAPIPMPPPTQRQRPQSPLHKRQQHLIPSRYPRDAIPRIHPLQTRQVALFEAEVGKRREVCAAGDWFDGRRGNAVFGAGDGGCGGDGAFGGCGSGGIEVVGSIGVAFYGGGLYGRG